MAAKRGANSPPARILIVEDSLLIAMGIEANLLRAGYEVVGFAKDARQALALAAETRPDLALVDLQLADGLTGPEIAERLQQDHRIPTLFCTANSDSVVDGAGGIGCLAKPFIHKQLEEAVAAALRVARDGIVPDIVPPGLRLWKSTRR